jgi:hypothetical protein
VEGESCFIEYNIKMNPQETPLEPAHRINVVVTLKNFGLSAVSSL